MKKIPFALAVCTVMALSACGTVGNSPVTDISENNQNDIPQTVTEEIIEETTQELTEDVTEESEQNTTEETTASPTEEETETTTEVYVTHPYVAEVIEPVTTVPVTTEKPVSNEENQNSQNTEFTGITEDVASLDNQTLINYAQSYFEEACRIKWNFTVGCPYAFDESQTAENEYGWKMYLITDPAINSMADIESDYYKLFSEKYPNELSETFMEKNGRAYCLNGARGSNIFYVKSEITSLDSRTENEIFFTVTNSYSSSMIEEDNVPYDDTAEFSLVLEDDGTWKVGQFILPY